MIEWHLEKRKLKDLKDYSKNPRKMTKEQASHLQASLDKFGLIDKPIINTDNTIIGGHQRVRLLRKRGIKEVECHVPNTQLSAQDVEELNIRHNKNLGGWDWDILANEWETEDLLNWGFSLEELGIDTIDIASEEDQNNIQEPCKDEDAITKLGDLYELGTHRLVCGDSTDSSVVSGLLDGSTPILMVTDPPYGVEYDASWRQGKGGKAGKSTRTVGKVKNDDHTDWTKSFELFPGNVVYIWCASWFLPEVSKSLCDLGFERKSLIIWAKQNFALSRGDYHWQHEPCWYAVRKGKDHNWQGSRKESTLWEIANMSAMGKSQSEDERTCHSTQKPIECMARPIRNNSALGEGVYDPFLGSGTTLIAAESLGRICYGIELSPAYCDVIVDRYRKYMENKGEEPIIKRNGENFS